MSTVYITLSKTTGSNHKNQVFDNELSIAFPVGAHCLDVVVEPLQQICNRFIELELASAQHPASCKAGCAVCCNQLIPLSGVEVLYLQKVVAGMPRRTRRRVYAAFKSLQEKAQRVIRASDDGAGRFDQRYFELGVACPFLAKGKCGIYPQRPLVCREYNVDSPPHLCKSPYTSPALRRIARGLNLGAMLSAFSARMLGIDKRPVPMFMLAQWGKENPHTRLTYDSQMLMESLLNAIKTTVEKGTVFGSFTWQYMNVPGAHLAGVSVQRQTGQGTRLLEPKKLPKLLVRNASAQNILKTIQTIKKTGQILNSRSPIIEIGAGRGYFRYLAGLVNDDLAHDFSERIIETESDARIVAGNHKEGKFTLRVEAAGLVEKFGKGFASAVLSMNVLDLFSWQSLSLALDNIRDVLQPGGMVVHIMSSAIHESIFQEIAADNGQRVLLPYASGNFLGVLLTRPSDWLNETFPQFSCGQRSLAQLCVTSIEEYIQMAQTVTAALGRNGQPCSKVLLHEYSLAKISSCLEHKGFELIHNGLISSHKIIRRNDIHKKVGKVNALSNDLGTMVIDQVDGIPDRWVKETSTFGLVIGRKTAAKRSPAST